MKPLAAVQLCNRKNVEIHPNSCPSPNPHTPKKGRQGWDTLVNFMIILCSSWVMFVFNLSSFFFVSRLTWFANHMLLVNNEKEMISVYIKKYGALYLVCICEFGILETFN